ncbi:MAG: tRNA (cytidine(56)-2'-O)-methyltransferase [Hadesarchaea archaeon]|nr:MAG: tRNA (cytidine(56)-2'-O)-methyltransferase [Hadesarchaea archaeon]
MGVWVLRLGHRPFRDQRLTTHVALTARAFGAEGMILADRRDEALEREMERMGREWGGSFRVVSGRPWREVVEEWKREGGKVVHLTMYGRPLEEVLPRLPRDLLVVVGAEKVPGELFELADFNVAVGNQPHSEVAALAVFLDRLFGGEELRREFPGARRRIVPSERGKRVLELG